MPNKINLKKYLTQNYPFVYDEMMDENNLTEKWIIIDSERTDYKITIYGQVISFKGRKYIHPYILNPIKASNGYLKVNLIIDGKNKLYSIHRLVAITFIPNPDNLPEVNHINGDKNDNTIFNLEWCTSAENIQHAFRNNLIHHTANEDHPMASITNETALKIANMLASGMYNMTEIAEECKTTYTVVKKIKNRYRWTKLTKDFDFSNYNKFRNLRYE